MTSFAVSEEKNRWLRRKMEELGVDEKEFEEKFIRASGRGGQKLNKTSSSVYLKHIPTGLEVKCMKERSQSLNRFLARRELLERIEVLSGKKTKADMKLDKIRKQKAKRKKRTKEKYDMLDIEKKDDK
ncbi:MAG: peptide chain release factor-like protein [Proteobacteria bacterium]|nr:peptide chain release factor-like protein [Pseudomonadota bacterium]